MWYAWTLLLLPLLLCRILRVLRVLRMKQVVRRHLDSAVSEAAVKLGFTLLCILLIAAGLFYELQKYGVGPASSTRQYNVPVQDEQEYKVPVRCVSAMCTLMIAILCGLGYDIMMLPAAMMMSHQRVPALIDVTVAGGSLNHVWNWHCPLQC
jgi:hypothetical protein